MKKLNWWQRLQCKVFCPKFEQNKPQDKPGRWIAVSILHTPFNSREVDTIEVEGLVNAYEVSRWLALKLDRRTYMDYGVEWAVRKGTNV